jgi:exonuclease III
MKGFIWNSDGLRDPAKHSLIKETVKTHKLDFIIISETGRGSFSAPFLNNLAAGMDYSWFCLPPRGRSGGILAGINNTSLIVTKVVTGDFCVKFHLKIKRDNFEWALVAVYGAAQDRHKPAFLAELVRICENETLPLMVGGDFNIIRRKEDKNNDNFYARWTFIFNAIIESLDLREIALSGRQYTWANRRAIPTFEKLDRILVRIEMEHKFPLLSVHAQTRSGSDHTPLLLDFGSPAHGRKNATFSFELSWLRQEGFIEMVKNEWRSVHHASSPMETWQLKIRHLRQFLRGWARNTSGDYKKEKERLLNIIDSLDIKAETSPLSDSERLLKKESDVRLAKLRRDEESKWAQRAKVKHIQEGGENTKYFHLIANGKHRKKKYSN